MASNLVLVMVHASMRAKIAFSRGRRAGGVAYSGCVFHSGSPITSQIFSHTGACVMK